MVFRCRMCGTCCMYLGDYIAIERRAGPFEFECESVSTGTPFLARVDDDKREIFLDRTWLDEHPAACRFLRPRGEHLLCTIHGTSPTQCKFYRCVVMRIFEPHGELVGKVTGTLALHSDNRVLREIWEAALREIPEGSADAEIRLQKTLESHGYRVE
ncbi:MAG: YkgJ family cysteine cluster protein [Methanomicrobiales archaeon]|nr:YkgJ family cysteine cluster protein [Methanomicrobiales archaeon]